MALRATVPDRHTDPRIREALSRLDVPPHSEGFFDDLRTRLIEARLAEPISGSHHPRRFARRPRRSWTIGGLTVAAAGLLALFALTLPSPTTRGRSQLECAAYVSWHGGQYWPVLTNHPPNEGAALGSAVEPGCQGSPTFGVAVKQIIGASPRIALSVPTARRYVYVRAGYFYQLA